MKLYKRIILVGHAASGKDYLAKEFVKYGFYKDVSVTTRPMRKGEVSGEDYLFTDEELFDRYIGEDNFYEHVEFNGWKYGTLASSWNTSDIFIMTPSGVESVVKKDREQSIVVFLDIPEEIRRQRMNLRSDADKTERRLKADEKDFKGFIDYDYRITDPEFSTKEWVEILTKAIRG